MEKLSEKDVKRILLEILVHFDNFCKEHHLCYSLSEGTLIGAVRHKGFIPWDDDIDIFMPRDDYERFLQLYHDGRYKVIKAQANSPFFFFCTRLTDTNTKIVFDKIDGEGRAWFYKWGIWIDINPLDNCPEDEKSYKRYQRGVGAFWALNRVKCRNKWMKHCSSFFRNISWLILKILLLPVPARMIRFMAHRYITQYNGMTTNRKCWWDPVNRQLWSFPASYFSEYTELEFEGKKFPVLKEWHQFLTVIYDDYMELPPESKRKPRHIYDAYQVNKK